MTDLECYINTLGFIEFLRESDAIRENTSFCLAGDLRDSTPRIMASVYQAVSDAGYRIINCGHVPTPALAYYGLLQNSPCIMVTGSHIPSDRNGIKFYKLGGEVLKEDEVVIKAAVARVRLKTYESEASESPFDGQGMLLKQPRLPDPIPDAEDLYIRRYTDVFSPTLLNGKKIVFYQHSSVGRDLFVTLLSGLGATVVPVDRSDVFVPIDTENVTPADRQYFQELARRHPDAFAILSTDGDSDRPFVIDETGTFHRGDELGVVVADWLKADYAAIPICSNDGVTMYLDQKGVPYAHTMIGSPYIIVEMDTARATGYKRVVGWESNGGFLTGCPLGIAGKPLDELPTRDTALPIVAVLAAAVDENIPLSMLFQRLPKRFTSSGLIDNFPREASLSILQKYSDGLPDTLRALEKYFSTSKGFGMIMHVDMLDGLRMYFDNNDIAHLRPSGNAPQMRIYAVADTQERADEIVKLSLAEPDGIIRTIQHALTNA